MYSISVTVICHGETRARTWTRAQTMHQHKHKNDMKIMFIFIVSCLVFHVFTHFDAEWAENMWHGMDDEKGWNGMTQEVMSIERCSFCKLEIINVYNDIISLDRMTERLTRWLLYQFYSILCCNKFVSINYITLAQCTTTITTTITTTTAATNTLKRGKWAEIPILTNSCWNIWFICDKINNISLFLCHFMCQFNSIEWCHTYTS